MVEEGRRLDAFCEQCQDVRVCQMHEDDPGSCVCTTCGHVILLMTPMEP